jgi:hypothetical protein
MKNIFISAFLFSLAFSFSINAQSKIEDDIEAAYQNAKKGIYWVLENIPDKKKIDNQLIADDKLYAKVKFEKVVNGAVIESTGYYLSNSVSIILYKSDDTLVKEGYLKK